jgi:hypothetical protein
MSDDFVMPEEGVAAETSAWADPDPKLCPVIPLGFIGKDIVFALPEGEIRREAAYRIQSMLATDIFVSVAGTVFLSLWRDPKDNKIHLQPAAKWLVRECRDRGYWDASRPQRGYGVWPSAKGPMVHAGDAVGSWPFKDPDWRPVAEALREETGGTIWLLRPPAPRPGKPATVKDVQILRDGMDRWRFRPLGDGGLTEADILFGHLGVMLLGAVPRFRPTVNVVGGAGTGKTTLSRFMNAAASVNAGELLDTFTDAGLRQSLAGEARGVHLDEAEPSPDGQQGPIERAMEIIRRMATGEGSAGRQGSINGGPQATSAVGCVYLASIFPLAPGDAMASRMVEVRLKPLGAAKGEADDELEALIESARAMSPALLARAVRDHERFRADVAMLKTALGETGQSQRGADLFSALAAGRRLLLFDKPLTLDEACEEVKTWSALVQSRDQSSSSQNPGQACLARIWALNSGQHVRDRHLTIGEMVEEEMQSLGTHEKVLKAWGLKVENGHAQADRVGPWLVISNNHPALQRGLAGTQYANWRGVLEHLGDLGERYAPKPVGNVRFGLHQSKSMAVPLTPWLGKPVVVGVDPRAATPFDQPDWDARFGSSSQAPSHEANHD